MAVRFYFVPKIGTGVGITDPFRPKYLSGVVSTYSGLDYGVEDTYFVGAEVTPAQHTSISGQVDVTSIPANLDAQIGANLQAVQDALIALKIPALWVTSTMTYRETVALVLKFFRILQRMQGRWLKTLFDAGVTLSTTMAELTQAQRDRLTDVAQSLGLDTSEITGSTTVAEALRILGAQLHGCTVMGESFP